MTMENNMEFLNLDTIKVSDILQKFLKEEVSKAGFEKVIFGLSGGVDSSVVAYLCVRTFPKENISALIMPYRTSNPVNMQHAEMVAKDLDIHYETREISPMVDEFFKNDPDASDVRRGNRMARERMCLLYDYSAKLNSLVIGTSNKTEILLGYGTIFGDLACAINPLGEMYKTQIWQIAEYLGVSKEIINKPPSADLWTGQTDEGEIGYTYKHMDELFYYMIEQQYSNEQLIEKGFSEEMITKIKKMMKASAFKGKPPVIAKLPKLIEMS